MCRKVYKSRSGAAQHNCSKKKGKKKKGNNLENLSLIVYIF